MVRLGAFIAATSGHQCDERAGSSWLGEGKILATLSPRYSTDWLTKANCSLEPRSRPLDWFLEGHQETGLSFATVSIK